MKISKFLPSSYKVLHLRELLKDNDFVFFITSDAALREEVEQFDGLMVVSSPDEIEERLKFRYLEVRVGDSLDRDEFIEILSRSGFDRVEYVEEEGQFAVRGSIVDIFPPGFEYPVRLDFFGDEVEEIRRFDVQSQKSFEKVDSIRLRVHSDEPFDGRYAVVEESMEPAPSRVKPIMFSAKVVSEGVASYLERGYRVIFATKDEWRAQRIRELYPQVEILPAEFREGFVDEGEKVVLISSGIFISSLPRRALQMARTLQVGELVVHEDYGIGKFEGMEIRESGGIPMEFLRVRYKDGLLYVPIYNLRKVRKYTGSENVDIDEMASRSWIARKSHAKRSAEKLAMTLMSRMAYRRKMRGFAFGKFEEEALLEATFPYRESPDQMQAIRDVLSDMESPKIMERLVAGDVGFGKTEVAIRAAFKAVWSGKQVAVLVPTTILAYQHHRNFKKRLEDFGIRVEMLSRLQTPAQVKRIKEDLARGKVDIVIGTHKLLSKDVVFKDLGLLIIDEEHKFGVRHKEKLRNLKLDVDTLYLSATPIPRTLSIALKGLMDVSVIKTPPQGRRQVITYIAEYSDDIIKYAISREIERGGQVFYIYNRIKELETIEQKLREFFPGIRIVRIHGRMDRKKIERAFLQFMEGQVDVLLSTNIVESGLDFPNANTIIVHRAEIMGLAELHQLRGRVGRSTKQGFAYFLVQGKLTPEAEKRLKAIASYSYLGSGLDIALADLEIRGAGNIFGFEQSGHAHSVGLWLYMKYFENALRRFKGEEVKEDVALEIRDRAFIPEDYIRNEDVRLYFYERLSSATTLAEIDSIEWELEDRFGPLPSEARKLLDIHRIRVRFPDYDLIRVENGSVRLFRNGNLEKMLSLKKALKIRV